MLINAIVKTEDILLVVLNLLFYLAVVAFAEDFVLRGVPVFTEEFPKIRDLPSAQSYVFQTTYLCV